MAEQREAFATIGVTTDGPVATIELRRPDVLNALSLEVLRDLEAAAVQLADDDGLKVVVLRGAGRAFCAGMDVGGFAGSGSRRDRDQGWRTAQAIEALPAVTVARIQGWCVGGGVVLASSCDLRVAAADARFSIPEVDLGIPLAWGGIPRLVREIGPARTKELVMTCRVFDADEAERIGFVNRVVDPDRLDDAVEDLVGSLVGKATFALLATKAHTSAVAEAMVHTQHSWSDAELLWAGLLDTEGSEARRRSVERLAARRSQGGRSGGS